MSRNQRVALAYGALCHGLFLAAVGTMAVSLFSGLRTGAGPFTGWLAIVANALLLLQFPIVHSWFLTSSGRKVLARLAPKELAADLGTTLYATVSSAQLLLVFALWSPVGGTLWEAGGALWWVMSGAYAISWIFLGKSMSDAGLAMQTGYLGWSSVRKGRKPSYPGLPTGGFFSLCRQPIYLAFSLILWTSPILTADRLVLAVAWTLYCIFGPILKERRYLQIFGEAFEAYRARVPYLLPGVRRKAGRSEDNGIPPGMES